MAAAVRGAVGHLRGTGVWDLAAGRRLWQGLQDASEVHWQQHQVEGVYPHHLATPVAHVSQISGHRH